MKIQTELYLTQNALWPASGRHILAQFDADSVVVYQAYNPRIGEFAAQHGYFGGDFKMSHMSWIKPNFLWMMYRSGWGSKENQETTLAVRLQRGFWEEILAAAVPSSFVAAQFETRADWQNAVEKSEVRLQWDPDHDPAGKALERRAVQLGLRGEMLRRYGRDAILEIDDISDFVRKQRDFVAANQWEKLETPRERIYEPQNEIARRNLGLD